MLLSVSPYLCAHCNILGLIQRDKRETSVNSLQNIHKSQLLRFYMFVPWWNRFFFLQLQHRMKTTARDRIDVETSRTRPHGGFSEPSELTSAGFISLMELSAVVLYVHEEPLYVFPLGGSGGCRNPLCSQHESKRDPWISVNTLIVIIVWKY